jgi:opacity protein-like surface antigen
MIRIHCASRTTFLLALVGLASWSARAQTSVAASLYGAFSGSTTAPSTSNAPGGALLSPSSAAGALIELRHISNPLVGYEATYAYNRANQSEIVTTATPPPCPTTNCIPSDNLTVAIPANAHALTGDWIVSAKVLHLRPFALAGGGVLFHVPTVSTVPTPYIACVGTVCERGTTNVSTNTQTKGVFVYGVGVDWGLLPHMGLRLQYRGNVYKLSSLLKGYSSDSAFTHTAEPMLGLYFRF